MAHKRIMKKPNRHSTRFSALQWPISRRLESTRSATPSTTINSFMSSLIKRSGNRCEVLHFSSCRAGSELLGVAMPETVHVHGVRASVGTDRDDDIILEPSLQERVDAWGCFAWVSLVVWSKKSYGWAYPVCARRHDDRLRGMTPHPASRCRCIRHSAPVSIRLAQPAVPKFRCLKF